MVSSKGKAVIGDFGNSQLRGLTLRFTDTTNFGLSVRWEAPELLVEDAGPRPSETADVYAYGMTVLETITGEAPYEGSSEQHVLYLVAVQHATPPRPKFGISNELWNILLACWAWRQSERPSMAGVEEQLNTLIRRPARVRQDQRYFEPLGAIIPPRLKYDLPAPEAFRDNAAASRPSVRRSHIHRRRARSTSPSDTFERKVETIEASFDAPSEGGFGSPNLPRPVACRSPSVAATYDSASSGAADRAQDNDIDFEMKLRELRRHRTGGDGFYIPGRFQYPNEPVLRSRQRVDT